jgi:hypothetical protein
LGLPKRLDCKKWAAVKQPRLKHLVAQRLAAAPQSVEILHQDVEHVVHENRLTGAANFFARGLTIIVRSYDSLARTSLLSLKSTNL